MFHTLPNEIINTIFLENQFKPIDLINVMCVNHTLKSIVNEYTNLYNINYQISDDDDKNMSLLCSKKKPLSIFQWLLKNNYQFSLGNIKNIIKYNRIDVIKEGLNYENFKKIIYNRFYIYSTHDFITENMNNIKEYENPLIIAGLYNRITIIKLILNYQTKKYDFPRQQVTLLDIAIKYSHKNLINYLIYNHYDALKHIINSKINHIISRVNNCEDLLFYLILNNKITITHKLLNSCIIADYNELFNYLYSKVHYKNQLFLLKSSIDNNNVKIFDTLINDNSLSSENFTNILLSRSNYKKEFILNIINNYRFMIDKEKRFINLCIDTEINDEIIIELIHLEYFYDLYEVKSVMEKENVKLLKELVKYL